MGKNNEYYKKRNETRMSQQNKQKVAEGKPQIEVQVLNRSQNDASKVLQNQKETTNTKSPFRDSKWNNRNNNYKNTNTRQRTVETAEDITEDIKRIEKEIKMEIQEIKTIKL